MSSTLVGGQQPWLGAGALSPGLPASGAVLTLVAGRAAPSPDLHAGVPPTPTAEQPLGLAGDVEFTGAHDATASAALEDTGAPWTVHGCADHARLVEDRAFGAAHSCRNRKGGSGPCTVGSKDPSLKHLNQALCLPAATHP